MPDEAFDELASLVEEGDAMVQAARSAQHVSAPSGYDATETVRVSLDPEGRLERVTVMAGWQRRLGVDQLPGAVIEAVRAASIERLAAWGDDYGNATSNRRAAGAGLGERGVAAVELDRGDFHRRLHDAATADMSGEDRRAALAELLALAEAIEQGIDDVSSRLQTTLEATHVGRSPDRHVTVTMTGGGDVVAVRFDRSWLRTAHELNLGRQITAALRAAAENVAAQGVHQLIADSALGEVQQATQDPLGLARRLRLTD